MRAVKQTKNRHIVVIGTSAGGVQALDALISQLSPHLPASIFIVQHMDPENTGRALVKRLCQYKAFGCRLAKNGEVIKPGQIYIAPPDNHLLLKKHVVLVTKGARENRWRPAIDPLFRSAAVAHGPSVIGVVLTGMLDDGTAGLRAIKQCGGLAVVQDPQDAEYPGMPQNAVDNLRVDHCTPIARMGSLLETLVRERPGKHFVIPTDVRIEAEIAEQVVSDVARVNHLGKQVPYNCPNCGGVLWEMNQGGRKRYRCHTGHSFTAPALLTSQSEKIEEILWVSLRMFEERKNLLTSMAKTAKGSRKTKTLQRLKEMQNHIDRIRGMLLDPQSNTAEDLLTRVKGVMAEPRRAGSTR